QLADLLHSGVPLLGSLELLQQQSSQPTLSAILKEVHADVAEGTRLADAFRKHPRVFHELAVSMVRAGEEGGFLGDVLKRISDFLQKHGIWLLVLGGFAVWWLLRYLATEEGRWAADKWRLKISGLGPIVRNLAIARFCRILGTLLRNGVPILPSLRIAKDATG